MAQIGTNFFRPHPARGRTSHAKRGKEGRVGAPATAAGACGEVFQASSLAAAMSFKYDSPKQESFQKLQYKLCSHYKSRFLRWSLAQ